MERAITIIAPTIVPGQQKSLQLKLECLNIADLHIQKALAIVEKIAQEKRHTLSESVKRGIQRKNEQGKVRLNHTQFLGYTKDNEGNLVIVPEEAEIVQLIYSLYLNGFGYRKIKKYLEQKAIKTVSGKDTWSTSTIDRMLANPLYAGTLVTQRAFAENGGESSQSIVENHHEPIIDSAIFDLVQQRRRERSFREKDSMITM